MGFIEEGRQLIQDFVTPEIRSIDARLTAVEKKLEALEAKTDKRFDALEGKIEKSESRIEKFELKVDRRIDSLEAKMERNHAQVMDTLRSMEKYDQLAERMARVESKLQHVA